MRLHEEYILRHNLNIPVIRYDSKSNLFLKTKEAPFRWSIFNISWRNQSGRPGFFEFTRMEPLYNGNGAFRCADKGHCVYWDKYESEIFQVLQEYKEKKFFAVQNKIRNLVAWEMFLYMYDEWISERMDDRFYQQVERSTMPTLDIGTRTVAYRIASRMLADSHGSDKAIQMLNYQIMPMINGHSNWLENLANA
jgi:hypothetical protein